MYISNQKSRRRVEESPSSIVMLEFECVCVYVSAWSNNSVHNEKVKTRDYQEGEQKNEWDMDCERAYWERE